MLQIQLYIENDEGALEEVELFKDESITLTQTIQDVKDIEKIFTDYTKTFNVPASKNNNKFFKHFYNYFIDGFDARKKKPAELFINHKPYKKGKIKLEGVQLKNNEPHTYKLTFFGNTVILKDLIGEDKLGNLTDLDYLNFYYNDSNIAEYLTTGKEAIIGGNIIDESLIFPLITHTNRLIYDSSDTSAGTYNMYYAIGDTNPHGVYFNDLKPAIRIYTLIKAIEKKYNIVFSEDFFNKTNLPFYNLYMWLHNKEGAVFSDKDSQYTVSQFTNVRGDVSDISGVHNAYYNNTYDSGKNRRKIIVKVTPSSNDEYGLVIKQNGEEFQKFTELTGTTYNGQETVNEIEIPNGDYTFYIQSSNVSTFTVDITIVNIKDRLIGSKTSKISFTGSAGVLDLNHFAISSNLPKMKTLDFLSGLFKMFNLTSYLDSDGTIVVKSLDDYYSQSQSTWDITDYLDKTETTIDAVIPFRQVNLEYKGRKSFLAQNHETTNNKGWGTLQYASTEKYEGDSYTIELPFEHFKYERLFDVSTGQETPIQYGWSVDNTQQSTIGEPLIFYATKPIATIPAVNISGQRVNISSPYTPSNSQVLLNLFGTQSQSLNFHAEYDEYSRLPNNNTLFQTYYKSYISDLFDKRKRLTFATAYLPLSITQNLSLADKIIIFDKIYRINKITTNFENNKSSLELINILEEQNFVPIKGLESVDISSELITADTTVYTADMGNLLADGFVLQSQPEIPVIIPSNTPTPTTSQPCVVTPATITVNAATSFCDKIQFSATINVAGTICNVNKIDEYGFLLSSVASYLTASNNIDTLKADSNIEVISVQRQPSSASLTIGEKKATKIGLTDPETYYARFYVRTNIDERQAQADVISSLITESTDCGIYGTADNTNLTADDTDTYTADVGDTDGDGVPEALAETPFLTDYATPATSYSSIPTLNQIESDATNTCGDYITHQVYYHNGTGLRPIVGDSIKVGANASANYNTYGGGTSSAPASFVSGSNDYYVIHNREEDYGVSSSGSTINGYFVVKYSTAKVVAIYVCPDPNAKNAFSWTDAGSSVYGFSSIPQSFNEILGGNYFIARPYALPTCGLTYSTNPATGVFNGSGTYPAVGDLTAYTSAYNYDGGTSSWPSAFQDSTNRYIALSIWGPYVRGVSNFIGFIVIDTITAEVVARYDCS